MASEILRYAQNDRFWNWVLQKTYLCKPVKGTLSGGQVMAGNAPCLLTNYADTSNCAIMKRGCTRPRITGKNTNVDFDDETLDTDSEIGSDELLSDDNLRLPEAASILVRVHAVRAWLVRRSEEATREVGEAALALQEAMQQPIPETRLRRRERQQRQEQTDHVQQLLTMAQIRLGTYEEAQALLEECITHTSGERVLVEYYLALEDLVQNIIESTPLDDSNTPNDFDQRSRLQALADVQHRVERVGAPGEDD